MSELKGTDRLVCMLGGQGGKKFLHREVNSSVYDLWFSSLIIHVFLCGKCLGRDANDMFLLIILRRKDCLGAVFPLGLHDFTDAFQSEIEPVTAEPSFANETKLLINEHSSTNAR